jgi:hypothetical protein
MKQEARPGDPTFDGRIFNEAGSPLQALLASFAWKISLQRKKGASGVRSIVWCVRPG